MIKCCECGNYGNCKPDLCIKTNEQGDIIYTKFVDPHNDHSKFCEKCGRRLKMAWSEKESNECWTKHLQCPNCGEVGTLEIQYISKVRKGQ